MCIYFHSSQEGFEQIMTMGFTAGKCLIFVNNGLLLTVPDAKLINVALEGLENILRMVSFPPLWSDQAAGGGQYFLQKSH